MITASAFKPKIQVNVLTERQNLVFRGTTLSPDEINKMPMDYQVVSVNTNRNLGNDNPTFTVTLVYQGDWFDLVTPNDLVLIKMAKLPKDKGLKNVFIGLVDDCRIHTSMLGTSPKRVVTITGRGLSKVFVEAELGVIKESDMYSYSLGWLLSEGIVLQGIDSGECVRTVAETLIGDKSKKIFYDYGDGKYITNYYTLNTSKSTHEPLFDPTSMQDYQGNMFSLFREFQQAPFNEMFFESNGDIEEFIVRKSPFDKEDWDALPSITLEPLDIVDEDYGRSDLETYTFYSVGCSYFQSTIDQKGSLGVNPFWYEPYTKKYGLRRLHVDTPFAAYSTQGDAEAAGGVAKKYQTYLFNWNIRNNSMYNGSFLVNGSNQYQTGTRLKVGNLEFYIEGVSHNFQVFTSFTTQLAVTRGSKPEDRFASPVGQWKEYNTTDFFGKGIVKPKSQMVIAGGNSLGPQAIDTTKGVPLFQQTYRSAIWTQGGSSISKSGCGLCCVAMMAQWLGVPNSTPEDIAAWAYNNPSSGQTWTYFEDMAYHYLSGYANFGNNVGYSNMANAIANGGIGVAQLSYGRNYPPLTGSSSHFIVVVAIDDGIATINDPNRGYTYACPVQTLQSAAVRYYSCSR